MRVARHKRFFLVHKARRRLCTAAIAATAFESWARRSGLQIYHFCFAQDNSSYTVVLGKTKVVPFRYQIEDDNQLESMLLRAEAITNGELYGFEKTACL